MIREHTVRPGETLYSIAEAYYGSGEYAAFIFRHNDTVIQDPNRIYPAQVITIPHLPGMVFG